MENSWSSIVVREMCYIYHKRNVLAKKRDSLRHKYKYLQDVKRSLQVRDNYKSSALYRETLKSFDIRHPGNFSEQAQLFLAHTRIHYLRDNPISRSFKNTTLRDIGALLLLAEARVCHVKVKIMRHTKKYEKRIRELAPNPEFFAPHYICGVVKNLRFYNTELDEYVGYDMASIERLHNMYIGDIAIDKMLTEGEDGSV